MTASFMSRAGVPASCSSTMFPIRSTPSLPARCISAASSAGHRIPKNRARRSTAAPQMVEVSRDGRRVYFTNSLYYAWDEQFYPDGVRSWMVKLNADPAGGINFDSNFFVEFDDYRAHQIRLDGGDCSSDSYCYP